MVFNERVNNTVGSFRQHISAYHSILFMLQIGVVGFLAMLSPFFVRALCLPSLVQLRAPLYFTFLTCSEHLAGVCSYPTATVLLDEGGWQLAGGIRYDVSVELILSPVESNWHLGPFQVIFETFDDKNERTASYRRTARVTKKRSSTLSFMKYVAFMPLYFSGWWKEESQLGVQVVFNERFIESTERPTNSILVQLQNRLAEIEEGNILMRARFGFFRNFLFDWPIASAFMLCVLSFSFGVSLIALYWAQRGLAFYMKRTDEHQVTTSSRTSSIGASSGFQSYGSMDSLCETDMMSNFESSRLLKSLASNRVEIERKSVTEPSVWELLQKSKPTTDVDLGKRQPAAKKSHWDMRSKATPEQLVSFFETVIEKSPSNLRDDVTKVIQSMVDGSIATGIALGRIRKLLDAGDYLMLCSSVRKSLPALRESLRKGEVTFRALRQLEAGEGARGEERRISGDPTNLPTIPTTTNSSEMNEMMEGYNDEASDDELPECPMLTDIPGWDVKPEPMIRRRSVRKRESST
uniref:Seipin n=1 Tax=Ascaris lumbricoides TaxID=6252 RepID=A0A0M3ICY9_ASCLU